MKTICLDLTATELTALRAEPHEGGLPVRLWNRITVHPCGCWVVSGSTTGKGHAKVSVAGKMRQFHRVVYQLLVGPIPAAHLLDHVRSRGCQFRNCANPNHLEPVTVRENTLRGDAKLFGVHIHPRSFHQERLAA